MEGSLIIVLKCRTPPYFATIHEIDLNVWPEKPTGPDFEQGTFKVLARLKQGGNEFVECIDWNFCSLAAQIGGGGGCSITPNLCLYPSIGLGGFSPYTGYILNVRTRTMEEMGHLAIPKMLAYLVSFKGCFYSFSDPGCIIDGPRFLPEGYCHEEKSWGPFKPFPLDQNIAELSGYAVFDDFILFNMQISYERQLLAYDCIRGNWHVVVVDNLNLECYHFIGLGVVVEETTFYALAPSIRSMLSLSITRGLSDDGDVVFSCCLRSKFDLSNAYRNPNLVVHEPTGRDYLVHFGDLKFCLVRAGYCNFDYDNQVVKIMLLKLEESKNLATLIHAMQYKIGMGEDYDLCHCCFLPPLSDNLDLVVSKKQQGESDDIDIALDIQYSNPALEAETATTLPKEEEETIGSVSVGNIERRKKKGYADLIMEMRREGSWSQMGSK